MPNEDGLTNSIQTIPIDRILQTEAKPDGVFYPSTRVISALSPVVVRRDDPDGAHHQEALGYKFIINRSGFPGLTRMDDGTLVLTLHAMLRPQSSADGEDARATSLILFSQDDGMSWTQPKRIDIRRCSPVNLGGGKLMLRGFRADGENQGPGGFRFSDDAGGTWSPLEPMPLLPDGRPAHTDVSYHPLVEGNVVTFLFWARVGQGHSNWEKGEVGTEALVWRYRLDSHAWDEPVFLPREWGLNEGSVTRAGDGSLVAVIRTQMLGTPLHNNDHLMGMATCRSTDEGQTWTQPARHFHYGHHHCSLQNLPDGRILLTYVARIGQLDGRNYHGVEAVLSHDHGATWDWERRCILYRTPDACPHSPQSAVLSDGRILTVLMDHTTYSWSDRSDEPAELTKYNISTRASHVHAVIWSIA